MSYRSNQIIKYRKYSHDQLVNAYHAVKKDHMTIRKAARTFNVPTQTLSDRISGKVDFEIIKSGPPTILSSDEEAKIVSHINKFSSYGYGYTRQDVCRLASNYAIHCGKRTSHDKTLTLKWFRKFTLRWPQLKLGRARTSTAYTQSHCSLESVLDKHNLNANPHVIYSIEDSVIQESGESSQTARIFSCGSASGVSVPPYFVSVGNSNMHSLLANETTRIGGTVTENSGLNPAVYLKYFKEHFVKYIPLRQDNQYILVLLCIHAPLNSVELVEWAESEKIVLFVQPPQESLIVQPLSVIRGDLQRIYNGLCHIYIRDIHSSINSNNLCRLASKAYNEHLSKEDLSSAIIRYNFSALIIKAYDKALCKENLRSAFKKTGIYPLNLNPQQEVRSSQATINYVCVSPSTSNINNELKNSSKMDIPRCRLRKVLTGGLQTIWKNSKKSTKARRTKRQTDL